MLWFFHKYFTTGLKRTIKSINRIRGLSQFVFHTILHHIFWVSANVRVFMQLYPKSVGITRNKSKYGIMVFLIWKFFGSEKIYPNKFLVSQKTMHVWILTTIVRCYLDSLKDQICFLWNQRSFKPVLLP